jgi:cobalt-zinc-cadmium efflux system membrane fusion protein
MRFIIVSLSFIVLSIISCKDSGKKQNIKTKFVLSEKMLSTTKVEKVSVIPLKNELNFYGKIVADNNKMIEIFPMVGGSVTKVFVELGDYVKKGELLATIRSMEVAGFEKELEDAKNDVIVAKNNAKVAEELYMGKLSAERDLIEAKSQLEKAQSQLHRVQETYKISLASEIELQLKGVTNT